MARWDVTGEWVAHQSNGFDVTFTIAPTGGDLTVLDVEARNSGGFGQGKGLISGDTFSADWFTDQSFSQLHDQPAGTQLLD